MFDKCRDFVESSNYARRHINVCSGGALCSAYLTIFVRHLVGLDVRISLVKVLSTAREAEQASTSPPPPPESKFSGKKAISNTDLILTPILRNQ